jgi:hypothetical protein
MTGKPRNIETGFSVIEALLILGIVGMLGFTGWFVWHAKQVADKTLTADNSSTPIFKKKPSNTAPQSSASCMADNTNTCLPTKCNENDVTIAGQKYLFIKELKLEIPLSSTTSDLCYAWTNFYSDYYFAWLASGSLYSYVISQDNSCSISNKSESNGVIPYYWIGDVSEQANTTSVSKVDPEDLGAHVALGGNLYLWYTPQDGCTSNTNWGTHLRDFVNTFEAEFLKSQITN